MPSPGRASAFPFAYPETLTLQVIQIRQSEETGTDCRSHDERASWFGYGAFVDCEEGEHDKEKNCLLEMTDNEMSVVAL